MATVTVYRYDNLEGETFDDEYAKTQGFTKVDSTRETVGNTKAMADALVSGASYHRTQKAAQDDADGVSTSSSVGTAASATEANQQAQALYSFMPQGVLDDFINNYIDTGLIIYAIVCTVSKFNITRTSGVCSVVVANMTGVRCVN